LKIPPLNITRLLFCLLGVVCLVGCSTGNKFASSFGKRRYEKGYYWDRAVNTETVKRNSTESVKITKRETVNRNSVAAGNRKSEATLHVSEAPAVITQQAVPTVIKKTALAQAVQKNLKLKDALKKAQFYEAEQANDAGSPADDNTNNSTGSISTVRVCFIFAALSLLAIIFDLGKVLGIGSAAFILLFLLFLVAAFISLPAHNKTGLANEPTGNSLSPANANSNLKQSNYATAGMVLSIVAIVVALPADFIAIFAAALGDQIGIAFVFASIPFTLAVIGIILSIVALNHNEVHRGRAIAGIVLGGIVIFAAGLLFAALLVI